MYRDLVYSTAELVSRDLPPAALLAGAVALGKAFFCASSLEIHLRDADFARGADGTSFPDTQRRVDEGVAEVLRTGAIVHAADARSMHVPLRFGGDARGVISIARTAGAPLDDLDASLFEKWALLLAVRIHELHLCAANARLEVLAGIDGLTGIHNRRAFGEMLTQVWPRVAASGTSLAIAMIDVDFFKSYNDKYGHVAGDACLKQIAQTLSAMLRDGDFLGRYGGEEFVVLFETTSLACAIELGERLRESIYELGIPHVGSCLGRVTASVGVAASRCAAREDASDLLGRADAALYGAKERGRNRVVADSYVSASSAALPQHDVRGNLPTSISSFCGRTDDVQRVRTALSGSRLVTVTGFGGVGKTRLALEVAARVAGGYPDGAWFVDLSGTRDADVIPALVATALGLRDAAGPCPVAALGERFREKTALLVLDNCEHLKAACADFTTTVLRQWPTVRILATSREPLDTADEAVVGLLPFAVPPDEKLSVAEAARLPAVALFVDRARAVTAFELSENNLAAVLDLCRRVDGIALGIELAAVRLKTLSLEQLCSRLDRRFGLLARKGTGSARQQTLRALIDWSFDLLAPSERRLFTRLGIFAGSFTLEAATAICSDDETGSVLDTLDALVDKSLVVVETRPHGEHTFRLFASIRSYVRDLLVTLKELGALEARHCAYYRTVAAAVARERPGPRWLTALGPLEYAGEDLRAALEATLGAGRDVTAGADLATMLADYWQRHGLAREGRAWLECALRREDAQYEPLLRARVRLALLDLHQMGEEREGMPLALDAMAAVAAAGKDVGLSARASFHLGKIHCNLGNVPDASKHLHATLTDAESVGDMHTLARALNMEGIVAMRRGDYESAFASFARCERLAARINRAYLEVMASGNLAELAREQGRCQDAIDLAKRALAIAEREADRASAAWLLCGLGTSFLTGGDTESAVSFTRDGIRMAFEVEDEWQALNGIDTYARIAFERRESDVAGLLLGYVDARLGALGVPRQPPDERNMLELAACLRSTLGGHAFEMRLRDGGKLAREAVRRLIEARGSDLPAAGGSKPLDVERPLTLASA